MKYLNQKKKIIKYINIIISNLGINNSNIKTIENIIKKENYKVELKKFTKNLKLKNNNKNEITGLIDAIKNNKNKETIIKEFEKYKKSTRIYLNIYKSLYNYEVIELEYLSTIKNISNNNSNNNSIFLDKESYETIKIKDYQFNFNKNFREYIKQNNNINLEEIQDIKTELNIEKEDITTDIATISTTIAEKNLQGTINLYNTNITTLNRQKEEKAKIIQKCDNALSKTSSDIIRLFKANTSDTTGFKSAYDRSVNNISRAQQLTSLDKEKQMEVEIKNYYSTKKSNTMRESKEIEDEMIDINSKIKLLTYEKNYNDNEKLFLENKLTYINSYIKSIDDIIIPKFTEKTTKKDSNNKILKEKTNDNFTDLLKIMNIQDTKIKNIQFNQSTNKVLFKISKDKLFDIYNDIINNTDKKIIKKKLNNYFTDNKKTNNEIMNNKKTFIIFLNEQKEKSNKDTYKLFFDKYNIYYEEFIKKINNILDNINNHKLKFNKDIKNENFKENNTIVTKKIDNILKENYGENNNNSGKYTKVLPYTDILLVYLLYLLFIINYLTYFYK